MSGQLFASNVCPVFFRFVSRIQSAAVYVGLFVIASFSISAQMTVTGTITGEVTDPSGAAVSEATVTLTSNATHENRIAKTAADGSFRFLAIPPETYTVRVEHAGFKAYERTQVTLTANERLDLGHISFELGAVTQTISVQAQGATVQTDSSENSAVLTNNQVSNLTARGRDVVSLLRTIPGVGYQADQDSVGGSYGTGTPSIAGTSSNSNTLAVDGVVSNDVGTPGVFSSVTTLDAIGEVKVIVNGYQAEYSGNGGPVVEVVTKSGGREFHGTGYWFVRNEDLNANDFFNNRNGIKRPQYRYNSEGGSIGGPIYIPHVWNTRKNFLFGFYNIEALQSAVPGALSQYTMPTALERSGDFSQSLDISGKSISIKNPTTQVAYPGNVVPTSQLNPNGLALLNTLPLPNFTNRVITGGNYNYQIQEVLHQPKRSQLFKIDVVPNDKDHIYVRGKTWISQQQGYAVAAGATPIGFFAQCYCFTESGISLGWTHIFSPTVVMEITSGARHNREAWYPYPNTQGNLDKVLRSAVGFNAGQWYPQANAQGIIPRFSFGSSIGNPPNVNFDNRFLTGGTDTTFSVNDNITITRGDHTIKTGFSFYRLREYEGEQSVFSGTFNFQQDVNNPFDTNYPFANAALGVFDSYTESNARYGANERQSIVEWFFQDSWKLTKRFTLDYGIRWSWYQEMYPNNAGQQSALALGLYKASDAPLLYQSAISGGVRSAVNPLTGQILPATYIGSFVPNSGNPAPGGVLSGASNYPRGFIWQQPVQWGPRLGFAYDPFGKGKTAIRGGAGILYNMRVSKWGNTTNNPPAIFTPVAYYGNIATFAQTAGVLAPSNTQAFNVNNFTPGVYTVSFGVQQDLGHSTLLDVSYASTLGRHLPQTLAINTVPYGAHFQTKNQDPTSPGKPLPDNFFRPYPGYANITYTDDAYTSNYNALLVSLNRRFTNGLQIGVSYTYSKYMDYTGNSANGSTSGNGVSSNLPIYRPLRQWAYGLDAADQTHNFVVNYSYLVPNLTQNKALGLVVNDWVLSGITQFVSGLPQAVTFTTVSGADLTGGGDGQRVNVVGEASANAGTFYRWFNPAAFALPGLNDPGNAGKFNVRQPGVANWDMAISKRFLIASEKRFLQFRWEAYNVFNHTQYNGINAAARFDNSGNQTNALFGQVISTRTPRVMQGSLRFTF
jgi:Carboxypeptidase regulatory-like domain/TonB-dependent Receptor Plug Domain